MKRKAGYKIVSIDTYSKEVKPLERRPEVERLEEVPPPSGLRIWGAQRYDLKCYGVSDKEILAKVTFTPEVMAFYCGVLLPLRTDSLVYSPALMEDQVVKYHLEEFKCERIFPAIT